MVEVREDTDVDVGYDKVEDSCKVALAFIAGHPGQGIQCVLSDGRQETIEYLVRDRRTCV